MASENELLWIEEYINTGDAKAATAKVFNSSDKNVAARTSALKTKLARDIDKRLREEMRIDSVALYANLRKLAIDSTSEQVQVKATMDLLDRGGYKPVDQVEDISEKPDKAAIESRAEQARQTLLAGISKDELQAMLDAKGKTEQ